MLHSALLTLQTWQQNRFAAKRAHQGPTHPINTISTQPRAVESSPIGRESRKACSSVLRAPDLEMEAGAALRVVHRPHGAQLDLMLQQCSVDDEADLQSSAHSSAAIQSCERGNLILGSRLVNPLKDHTMARTTAVALQLMNGRGHDGPPSLPIQAMSCFQEPNIFFVRQVLRILTLGRTQAGSYRSPNLS